MSKREFSRSTTPEELRALQPGDRLFAAQQNAHQSESLRPAIHWYQVVRMDDAGIYASPIWDGMLAEPLLFDSQYGVLVRPPLTTNSPRIEILAVDKGPRFALDQPAKAIQAFIERVQASAAKNDVTQDVLAALHNAKSYLREQDKCSLEAGQHDLAAKALFSNMNLASVEHLITIRGQLFAPFSPDGPLVKGLREAHDLIDAHWAGTDGEQARLATKVVNDLRVAMVIIVNGRDGAASRLPIQQLSAQALSDAFQQDLAQSRFLLSMKRSAESLSYPDAVSAGEAFYEADATMLPSVVSARGCNAATIAGTTIELLGGRTQHLKWLPSDQSADAQAFCTGYFKALTTALVRALRSTPSTDAGAVRISEQFYEDLRDLSTWNSEQASQLWQRHFSPSISMPSHLVNLPAAARSNQRESNDQIRTQRPLRLR